MSSSEVTLSAILNETSLEKEHLSKQIVDLKNLSEQEILACGNVLEAIVERVHIFSKETDQMVSDSMAHSEFLASQFIQDIRTDIQAQNSAVENVLGLADGIEKAIVSISNLTQQSNLLALNSKIEAARLGAQAQGFTVIAGHMKELSNTIHQVSKQIEHSVDSVRKGLPLVKTCANNVQNRAELFIATLNEHLQSTSLQSEHKNSTSQQLDKIMSLSNQALSHLQFQDSLSQKLSLVDQDYLKFESRVQRLSQGETNLENLSETEDTENSQLAGEIILF